MKKNSASLIIALAASTLLFSAASALAVGHDHMMMKIGKKGETTFSQETIVGNITLKPGNYIFQHKVVGTNHFMSFQRVSEGDPFDGFGGGVREGHPIMIKCRIEPLNKKVSETSVDLTDTSGGIRRIISVEVAGENVAHLF